MNYLFYTDTDDYLHFKFQTTDKKDDISRFLYYDASLYFKSRKNKFDKFGDDKAKRKFKEVIIMTDVDRMIYEDGLEEVEDLEQYF